MSTATKQRRVPAHSAEKTQSSAGVQTVAVSADEAGMRVDRFLEARFPGLSFSHIQRIIRKGELRVNGKRAQPKQRLEAGQAVRIPPLRLDEPKPRAPAARPTSRLAISSNRSRCTRTPTCWCSTSPWGWRCKAAPAPRAISTACSTCCATRKASARVWCTGWTRTPLAVCWWQRPASRRPRWRRPSVRVRREKSTGRWSRACPSRDKAASRLSGQGGA